MRTTLLLALGIVFAASATHAAAPPTKRHRPPRPMAHAPARKPTSAPKPPSLPAPPPAPEDMPRVSTMAVSDYQQVGWWRGDGSATDDMKLNGGTATGGVGYAPAMNGRGFRFTGNDDAVQVSDSFSLRLTTSMTVNAWVNVDSYATPGEDKGMILFRGDDRGGLDPYCLWVGSDQRLLFHIESEQGNAEISAPIPARRFIMMTAILDDSTGRMELYENTVLVARVATRIRPLADLDPTQHPGVGIGNCNAGSFRYPFHGVINDLRVWRRVLAPGEIRSLYGDCLSVPSPLAGK